MGRYKLIKHRNNQWRASSRTQRQLYVFMALLQVSQLRVSTCPQVLNEQQQKKTFNWNNYGLVISQFLLPQCTLQANRKDRRRSTPVPISCVSSLFRPFSIYLPANFCQFPHAQVVLRTIPFVSRPIRTTLLSKVLRFFFVFVFVLLIKSPEDRLKLLAMKFGVVPWIREVVCVFTHLYLSCRNRPPFFFFFVRKQRN